MNDTLQTLLRSVLKIGGGYLLSKGLANDSQISDAIGGVSALAGIIWGVYHRGQTGSQSKAVGLIAFLGLALGLSGCTTAINHGYITSVSNKGFGIDVETANQGNGTPTVKLGFFSSRVMFTPTSTNGPVNAPRVMDAFMAKSALNPFDNNLKDDYGTGDVSMGGTNDISKAIVPGTYAPIFTPAVTNKP